MHSTHTDMHMKRGGKGAKGRENFEIWHIGKSGQEIFLTDFASEKTWTLYKGVEFNYTTPL